MVKGYSREPAIPKKGPPFPQNKLFQIACKAQGFDLRTHFKNTFQVGRAIRGMQLTRAQQYLQDVLQHKRAVPYVRYNGGIGRTAQSKEWNIPTARWPQKSVQIVLDLLRNLEANALVKNLDAEKLHLTHVQVNHAAKGRRRTYRAHGRINPYMNNPCHVEIWAAEKEEDVQKAKPKEQNVVAVKKNMSRRKLKIGE